MDRVLIRDEARRISGEQNFAGESAGLHSFSFLVVSEEHSVSILEQARVVLANINQRGLAAWPPVEEWKRILPAAFIAAFRLPLSKSQAQEWLHWWRNLPPDEQMRAENERVWSLDDWLYWMEPDNRHWYWKDAEIVDDHRIKATVLATEWPFPWGSFRWLFLASGAKLVSPEK